MRMKKTKINIFIENDYESFEFPKGIELSEVVKDATKATEYFLSQNDLLESSCLQGYSFNQIYFDVVLTNDEKIHEINREYRDKDSATDVITFAIFADSPEEERFVFDGEINLGEIIVSLDHTMRQSKEACHGKTTFKDELYFLLTHGILHLLGYDHQDEESLQQMWSLQHELINKGIESNV